MSLMERVRAAGNDTTGSAAYGTATKLDDLRGAVHEQLPSEVLAHIASGNTLRAENEVRRACEVAFRDDPWLASGQAEQEALVSALIDSVFGLGPLEALLADEKVTEIMVNASRSLFVEIGGKLFEYPKAFANDDQVRALIDRIIGPLGRRIDESSPMVDARLAAGHRVNAIVPPISMDGPVLTIRKFRQQVFSLEEMQAAGSFDETMRTFFRFCMTARKNIAVSGGTGSGKTTLLNALSSDIDQDERIITIEDSAELRFLEHNHVVRLEARPANAEGTGEITIRQLVTNALRMRPDRIIVGECRGGEALDMLQAMNTGHDGSLTTLHANSPADALMRMQTMVRFVAELPVDVIAAQIASALDVVIQTSRAKDGSRFVSSVAEVSFDRTLRDCLAKPLYEWDYTCNKGKWLDEPVWLNDATAQGFLDAREVEQWKRAACLAL